MPLAAIGPTSPSAQPRIQASGSGSSFRELLDAHASPRPGGGAKPAPLPEAAARGLEWIEQAQARLEGVLAAARSGRSFTAQELIGLQASAYRFSQAVELSAKLVEQGAQAVKQALHAQV